MKNVKKIAAITAVLGMSSMALTGCASNDQLNALNESLTEKTEALTVLEQNYASLQEQLNNSSMELEAVQNVVDLKDSEISNLSLVIEDLNEQLKEQPLITTISSEGIVDNYEEVEVNVGQNFSVVIDDNDLDKLLDTKISFNDEEIDVAETITITDQVQVGSSTVNEDFCENPFLIINDEKAINYMYAFEDEVNVTSISDDEPLKISFLGKDLEIVGFDGDEMIVREGKTFWITQDEAVENITLVDVSSDGGSAGFNVGEQTVWIDVGDEKVVNGVSIKVNDVKAVNSQLKDSDIAEITVNKVGDVEKRVEHDDVYEGDWKWSIIKTGNVLNSLGVVLDIEGNDLDDDFTPLKHGEFIELPEGYITLSFSEKPRNTVTFDFSFDEYGSDDIKNLEITTDCKDCIVLGSEETDKINFNGSLSFYDDDGTTLNSSSVPKLVVGDTSLSVSIDSENITVGNELLFKHTNLTFLGSVENDDEASEVNVNNVDVGSNECEVLSDYGIIVDKSSDKDEFSIVVPDEQLELSLIIK